jgi:hypothetical protein
MLDHVARRSSRYTGSGTEDTVQIPPRHREAAKSWLYVHMYVLLQALPQNALSENVQPIGNKLNAAERSKVSIKITRTTKDLRNLIIKLIKLNQLIYLK